MAYDEELIEFVAKALRKADGETRDKSWHDYENEARAAIAAVLEWQGKQKPFEYAGAVFRDGDTEHIFISPSGEIMTTKDSDGNMMEE